MRDEDIQLWNVDGQTGMCANSQSIVNILGHISENAGVERLSYRLNGGSEVPVFVNTKSSTANRLTRLGDFNIDTISRSQLFDENVLELVCRLGSGEVFTNDYAIAGEFRACSPESFDIGFDNVVHSQQIGQIVDGNWCLSRSELGEPCLEIHPADAGLDRIILFGSESLASNYTLRARIEVTKWTRMINNVGLLFRWNPHLQGDGSSLPSQWTTGLAYYYSGCRGLRIRMGVDVHTDQNGNKLGDHILGESMFSPWRYWANKLSQKIGGGRAAIHQIVPGTQYWFELTVEDEEIRLNVRPVNSARPSASLIAPAPTGILDKGPVGIIAHQCAVRLYEFSLRLHSAVTEIRAET